MRWPRKEQTPDDPAAPLIVSAMRCVARGDRDEALGWLDRAAASVRDAGVMHQIALLMWQELGETTRAEALLRKGADTGSVPAMIAMGVLLQHMDRASDAEQWLRRCARTGDADALYNLGNLLEKRGDLDAATDAWRKAGAAGSLAATSSLGLALYSDGRDADARKCYKQALLLQVSQETLDRDTLGRLHVLGMALAAPRPPTGLPSAGQPDEPDGPAPGGDADDLAELAAALHAKFLAERDFLLLDAALLASRAAVDASEPESPARAEALRLLGSLLRADFERSRETAQLADALSVGRAAVYAARDDRSRGHAYSSLGTTLMIRYTATRDGAALDEGIIALDRARHLLGANDPEWPGITASLGGALNLKDGLAGHGRPATDTGLIDKAIGYLEAAIGATPPDDPELPARRYNLAVARIHRGMRAHSAPTVREAAILLRKAHDGLPEGHPARVDAMRMLAAIGDVL